jgi:hypothetical protein
LHPDKQAGNEAAIREHIAHKDRARKLSNVGSEELRRFWAEQLNSDELSSLHPARRRNAAPWPLISAAEAVTWAESHLFERRSVVREHELWRHALEAARGDATPVCVPQS